MIWELEDVIQVAQTCIMLHNLIVRMQQYRDVRDEAGCEDLSYDAAAEAATQYETNKQRVRQKPLQIKRNKHFGGS